VRAWLTPHVPHLRHDTTRAGRPTWMVLNDSARPFSLQNCRIILITLGGCGVENRVWPQGAGSSVRCSCSWCRVGHAQCLNRICRTPPASCMCTLSPRSRLAHSVASISRDIAPGQTGGPEAMCCAGAALAASVPPPPPLQMFLPLLQGQDSACASRRCYMASISFAK
jgi:hypothetical protein